MMALVLLFFFLNFSSVDSVLVWKMNKNVTPDAIPIPNMKVRNTVNLTMMERGGYISRLRSFLTNL